MLATSREMTPAEREQDDRHLEALILASRDRIYQELAAEERQLKLRAAENRVQVSRQAA